jgi:hypothetical protein
MQGAYVRGAQETKASKGKRIVVFSQKKIALNYYRKLNNLKIRGVEKLKMHK